MNLTMPSAARFFLPLTWLLFGPPARPAARERTEVLHGLCKGQTLTVEHPLGHELTCQRGNLWITHDNDDQDYMLAAGETYRPDSASRMLVHALDDALLWSHSSGGVAGVATSSRRA